MAHDGRMRELCRCLQYLGREADRGVARGGHWHCPVDRWGGEPVGPAWPGSDACGGISPIDVAANAVAVAVAENVAHCSATLAPEPIEGVQKAETATTELRGRTLRAPPTSGRSLRLCSRCRRRGQWRRGAPSIRPVSNTGADSWRGNMTTTG